ncbi:hypothetical protein N8614_04145, partial [Akkermansiaceae bacterium]|nr:hypothetical protein [Akkermansiaceae bacterium]
MKIALVISCINSKSKGSGGHYYSLLETALQLGKKHQILIISIGDLTPKAFRNIPVDHVHFHCRSNFVDVYFKLRRKIKEKSINLIHAYDKISYFWARQVSWWEKIPSCLTICGGGNVSYFPLANDLILFSKENQAQFLGDKRYEDSRIYLVPNRLREFHSDEVRILEILKVLKEKKSYFKLLRIARIGRYYHKSSLQLINLVRRLNKDGIKCCVIFIGSIEEELFYKELRAEAPSNVFFFTNDYFTVNAKELIELSDGVLGTGRSLMEASSKGKILLVPGQLEVPCLITRKNFEEAFYFNFSERIIFNQHDEDENYFLIKDLIAHPGKRKNLEKFSSDLFQRFFSS